MRTRGKRVAWLAGAVAIAALIAAGIANEKRIREKWWLHKLRSADEESQRTAAEKLGDMGSVEAVPELLKLAPMPRPFSHPLIPSGRIFGALWQIGDVRDAKAIPFWIEALGSPDPRVRSTAAMSLGKLGPTAERAIPALIQSLNDERGPEEVDTWPKGGDRLYPQRVTAEALCAMSKVGQSALAAALRDLSPSIRAPIEQVLVNNQRERQ